MKKLNLQELHDIMMGCAILGTGGGGSLTEGASVVEKQWNAGKEFKLLDFSEIQDDAYYASPYYCGCMVPEEQEAEEELFDGSDIALSVRELEKYMNTNFHGVVSIEYGAGNTGEVMAIAAQTGKYIVDADAAGRAVPELQFSTYYVTGQPIIPLAVGTIYGDVAIIPTVKEDARAEALTRFMAVATHGAVGMTDHPILGKDLKHAVIPGAISRAQKVGRARREAAESGKDPIQAILETAGGKLLFTGRVTGDTNWYDKDGFTLTLEEKFNDYERTPVPPSAQRTWFEQGMVWLGEGFGLSGLAVGGVLAEGLAFPNMFLVCIVGALIVVVLSSIVALIGTHTHLPTAINCRRAFGGAPNSSVSFSVVVSSFAVGIVMMSDFSRFSKTPKDCVVGVSLGYFWGYVPVMVCGAFFTYAFKNWNVVEVMVLTLGLGIFGALVLALGQWTTNDNNLYGSVLSLMNTLDGVSKIPRMKLTFPAGRCQHGHRSPGSIPVLCELPVYDYLHLWRKTEHHKE